MQQIILKSFGKMRSRNMRGANLVVFVVLLPLAIAALAIAYDFNRMMILKNQVRMIADSSALACAGALDLDKAVNDGNFVINDAWGRFRVDQVLANSQNNNTQSSWQKITISNVTISGKHCTVTVNGQADTLWLGMFTKQGWNVTSVSGARAATGISHEW